MKNLSKYLRCEIFHEEKKYLALRLIKLYVFGPSSKRAVFLCRLSQMLYKAGYKRSAKYFSRKLETEYGIFIDPKIEIGIGFKMPHPNGIVIGIGSTIGNNVTIFQQVTLGGARMGDVYKHAYPTVGDDCILFSGAKVLGKIKIGNNCIVAANAVVLRDVPDNCTAIGMPAENTKRVI